MVPLKCISNLLRTREMPVINCENNLILTWSKNCFSVAALHKTKFCIRNLFSKYDQIRSLQRIWPHLLKKSLMEKKILSGKNFGSEFSYIEVWFTDQSFKLLEIKHVEDKINISHLSTQDNIKLLKEL